MIERDRVMVERIGGMNAQTRVMVEEIRGMTAPAGVVFVKIGGMTAPAGVMYEKKKVMIAQFGKWPRALGNGCASRGRAAQVGKRLLKPGMFYRVSGTRRLVTKKELQKMNAIKITKSMEEIKNDSIKEKYCHISKELGDRQILWQILYPKHESGYKNFKISPGTFF